MISERLDNIANYSQLLRSFNELSLELVDLAHCVLLARCAPTCAPARAHWPLSDYLEATQAGRQVNWQQQQAKVSRESQASWEQSGRKWARDEPLPALQPLVPVTLTRPLVLG